MDIFEIIEKKENSQNLTKKEIEFVVNGYTNGEITDEIMTRMLRALVKKSMNDEEIYYLTKAMQNSGETCDLSRLGDYTVDKHSTGGVSDSTTLIIAPILACAGLKMLKASGRALGFTGGTADKIEIFDGYDCEISFEKATRLTIKNGACIVSQSMDLAPADKKIYALRDRTGLVESIPLIASSVMSKKLASNNKTILLDIKVGNGAFMKNLNDAEKLAKIMVDIGKRDNKNVVCLLTDMSEPLGYNIGNYPEIMEVIEVLSGKKGKLTDLSIEIAVTLLVKSGLKSENEARKLVGDIISSGKALEKFKQMIISGGGDISLIGTSLTATQHIYAKQDGYVSEFLTQELGNLCHKVEKEYGKYTSGIVTYHKIGDKVNSGDKIISLVSDKEISEKLLSSIEKCVIITKEKCSPKKLILKVID